MANTYTLLAVSIDAASESQSFATAHAEITYQLDGGPVTPAWLCGLDSTSADTLKAGIQAYVDAQVPAAQPPVIPADIQALIGQLQGG